MMRHDEALMWEYAARELSAEDAKLVQHHLTECPECQEKLTDVRTARGALQAVKGLPLAVSFQKADAAIVTLVERRMEETVFSRPWVVALSGALVLAGLALAALGLWPTLAPAPASPFVAPPIAIAPAPVDPTVERAAGLTVIGAQTRAVEAGAALQSGDVLRTRERGEAVLKLPEGTRLKVTGASELALTRVKADDVTLSLQHGHLAVAASHSRRKGFVVLTNGLMVTVVGTTFSVSSSREGVEVAVAEGRVSVEPPKGLPMFVSAGQRARYDARWRSTRGPLTAAQKRELQALAEAPVPPVAQPAPPAPALAAQVAASGGQPRPEARGASGADDLQLAALPPVVDDTPPIAPVPPPAVSSKPDMAGLPVPLLASPVDAVNAAPTPPEKGGFNEWKAPEAQRQTAAARLSGEEIPTDAEEIFLQRAERSLSHGGCERYLLGLQEIASDQRRSARAENARIYRARCFDSQMNAKAADDEYRRYLNQYPSGRWADEARAVLGYK